MAKQKTKTVKKLTKTKKQLKMVGTDFVPLGTKLKDMVTGFEGIAIARIEFLNGCIQYMVKPTRLDKDNKPLQAEPIDSQQLAVVDRGIVPKEEPAKKEKKSPPGGIMPDTPKM